MKEYLRYSFLDFSSGTNSNICRTIKYKNAVMMNNS